MHAHLVQLDIAWEDKAANHGKVSELLDAAGVESGDLIVLPELFDTGFSLAFERTADGSGGPGTPGPTLTFLAGLARRFHTTVHGSRTLIGADGRGRNMATIVGPDGSLLAEYAKAHPFFGPEADRFTGGDSVTTYVWAAPAASSEAGQKDGPADTLRVCPAVCYDLRFPELFRRGLKVGAELYAVGANWPTARTHHWRALLIARAIENQAFVLGVNRVGNDPNLSYSGGSIAVDPQGAILGELGYAEGVLGVELDPESLRSWRRKFPAWRDAKMM